MTECTNQAAQMTAQDLMREIEIVIPMGMSVGAAAAMLEAAEIGIASVVDSRGRCVGVFTIADHERWLERSKPESEADSESHFENGSADFDAVRYHTSGRFAAVTPDTGVEELQHRLNGADEPYLVVLDRQARPQGIVCALDVFVSDSGA